MDLASLPSDEQRKLCDTLLDRLEKKEYAALVWGFTDGAFTEDELDDEASTVAGDRIDTPSELWEFLHERQRLLVRLRRTDGSEVTRYRTRFAETVRLLFRLRQLFPPRRADTLPDWVGAKTLVADYRLVRKPRNYPRRDIIQRDVMKLLQSLSLPPRQEQVVREFTKTREHEVKLARFQCDATRRILGAQDSLSHQGTIICAGTGTGKTLAFYLPVFARLVDAVQAGVYDTLCLAVYPRNELLKDQFRTAYQNARILDGIGSRPLRIGVYFGGTPNNAGSLSNQHDYSAKSWKTVWRGHPVWGRICPFLDCPVCRRERDVSSDLIWRVQDYAPAKGSAPVEQLWCDTCNAVTVTPDTILLTRSMMDAYPPDILFTTTEMLNRSLCERAKHRLLGIGTKKLRFVLLDEAHTYSGVSGAQNALVIRRWKHAAQTKCHFVGLSATLREPRRFFAQLIGEPEGAIEAITVEDADKESEGWEYQLALRGDPSSQASLLSTSVQTVMLLARMLDPLNNQGLSGARFPPKLFAFTDNLDVANRFYHTLRDAENFRRDTGNRQSESFPLSMERRDTWRDGRPWTDALDRIKQGQMWNACNEIGNALSAPLRLDKVNSQDGGVDPLAKIIVATSSLEVGYDDSAVGAVVQHKAARGAASFLQRKGRAGRKRTACPWTVVVLSDFGRDRIAYQGYEQLFDPELDRTELPIYNRYVLKIQAVFALIDYIGTNIRGNFQKHWNCLSRPSRFEKHRSAISDIAHGILTVQWRRKQFREYLQAALGIDAEQAKALLWQSPRALMTEVLPTIVRRMATNFAGDVATDNAPAADDNENRSKSPLPEFITANLFSNLLVPEVEVIASRRVGDPDRTPEPMELQGVLAALQQTAPGRVTRRYAVDKRQPSNHWVVPSFLPGGETADLRAIDPVRRFLRIGDYFDQSDRECVAQWRDPQTGIAESITVHRPRRICLRRAEDADPTGREWVDNLSRTDLQWQSQLHPTAAPNEQRILVSAHIALHRWVPQVRFFCFSTGNPLRTQRFSVGATGTLYIKPIYGYEQDKPLLGAADKRPVTVDFVESEDVNRRAAVGYETDVDAAGFECDLPDALLDEVLAESITELRAPYFIHLVRTATFVAGKNALTPHGVFDRDWFAQTALSVFAAVANSQSRSIQDVIEDYAPDDAPTKERWRRHIAGALDAIFQLSRGGGHPGSGVEEIEDESVLSDQDGDVDEVSHGDDEVAGVDMPRQRVLLEAGLCDDAVRHALITCGAALYEAPTTAWHPWLRERLRATLGAALLSACEEVSSDFSTAELYLDIAPGEPSDESDLSKDEQSRLIWVSESIPGGAGVIEEVRRVIRFEEDRFFSLVANALQAARADRLHRSLRHLLTLTQKEPVLSALRTIRDASNGGTLAAFNAARETLIDDLQQHGVSVSHSVANALNVRILHPSSDAQTDALLLQIFEEWDAIDSRFHTAIDARVFAFLAQQHPAIRAALDAFLRRVANGQEQNPKQRYNAVYAMLWPRGYAVRNQAAESYNPFAPLPPTDPLLLERRMGAWHTESEVRGGGGAPVQESLINALRAHGIVEWIVPQEDRAAARQTLLTLMRTPIDCGLLIGYARAGRVSRRVEDGSRECVSITLTLPEAGYDS